MSLIEMSAILGNLGEFIGSVAVLATLIYLTVQVKVRNYEDPAGSFERFNQLTAIEQVRYRNFVVANVQVT